MTIVEITTANNTYILNRDFNLNNNSIDPGYTELMSNIESALDDDDLISQTEEVDLDNDDLISQTEEVDLYNIAINLYKADFISDVF